MMMEANLASGTEQVEEGHDSMGMEEEEDSYENIDGVRLRRIQIEGEEDEYLMDEQGNIYDLEGNYVGTANGDGGDENAVAPA